MTSTSSRSTAVTEAEAGTATKAGHDDRGGKEEDKDLEKQEIATGSDEDAEAAQEKEETVKAKWTPFDPFGRVSAAPPTGTMDDAQEIPLATASFWSKLGFFWIQPLLVLGYKRVLVPEDLWKMDHSREAGHLADEFERHFYRRKDEIEAWNAGLADGSIRPSRMRKVWWRVLHGTLGIGEADGTRKVSIAWALSDTFKWRFWSAGLFKVVGDLASVCSPLLTRQIIYFVTDARYANEGVPGYTEPHVGKGVGLAIGLFILQEIYSGQCGILARGALIAAVYRRAMVLSGKSRVQLTNSKLVNHISTDISRIDFSFFHFSWTCGFQLLEVLVILLVNIGVASLTGIALVVIAMPLQMWLTRKLFNLRKKSMVFTDRRIKLISELLLGIRVIKLFSWEGPYLEKVHQYRKRELLGIQKLLTIRAANQALATSIPLLSSILVFVTYGLTGHAQNPAIIWTTLSLLNLLRQPLMLLPNSLSTMADAKQAMDRLVDVFTSEVLDETFVVDPSLKSAVTVSDASFTWESSPPSKDEKGGKSKKKDKKQQGVEAEEAGPPSKVEDGKSSLLQGLIGEMRKTKGSVVFDLDMLPNGDMTEIGEKGIALSGGQRQRVSVCRTLYFNADIVLFDDPLSALDAHVGRRIMDDVILGALAEKTRILATHALHFMGAADKILYMENGKIVEQGTYDELVQLDGAFAKLSKEHGGARDEEAADAVTTEKKLEATGDQGPERKKGSGIMQAEERKTGAVAGSVYKDYLSAAKGFFSVPTVLAGMVLMQAAQVLSQFDLTWWQDGKWGHGQDFYMGLYGGLAVGSALFTFLMGAVCVAVGNQASRTLHRTALESVIRAPMSLFDTTPMGRVLGRFTKDIDSIDNRLIDSARMSLTTLSQICGAFILIAIVEYWFIIAVVFLFAAYIYVSKFYRASAREIKRMDNLLRSTLYAHFSESLAGLTTIRAFGECSRFIENNEIMLDLENRAYFLTIINQRWLGIRLDFMGSCLTFIVSMLCVGQRHHLNPSNIGLVLASILQIQQALSMAIRQNAEVDNNLSSVERLQHYADSLEHEAPSEIPETAPAASWPQKGAIEFSNVEMRYRPELPPVLRGFSLKVRPGEKVGVVGRTGAGKSTLMLTLFRIVELSGGSITIDDIDISKIGLKDLRTKLAIIPQDPYLYSGTLRTNLDPFGLYEDAVLWSALKRAWLVERNTATVEGQASRFNLDTVIEDEGLNMSVGERSLVSLARALVKDSQIVVLDEATANVDMETDARIQRTIATEFKNKTLLCIAHRINTIIGYDRVLVMDKGQVAAFETPAELFRQEGIFHSLCVQSGITLEDIGRNGLFGSPSSALESVAIRLKEVLGDRVEVTIYEKSTEPGGIWRDSLWPDAGVDVPIHFYSLYSDLYPDWDYEFASQKEVLPYWHRLIAKHRLNDNIQYSTKFLSSAWSESSQSHEIELERTSGEKLTISAEVLISAAGPLVKRTIPKLPGLETFEGRYFHNLDWDTSVRLEGKRVAVFGSGSSGVQLVPGVAALPGVTLTHFIRSGGYFAPKVNRQFSSFRKFIFRNVPFALRFYRISVFVRKTWAERYRFGRPDLHAKKQAALLQYLEEKSPPEYLADLTPNYPLGCKRLPLDAGWLDSLHRKNVELVRTAVKRVTATSIETTDGRSFPVDVIVFATGADVPNHGVGLSDNIRGQDGLELRQYWNSIGGPQAYIGLAVPFFPNYFVVIGPNATMSSWGHTAGAQGATIARLIKEMLDNGLSSIQPRVGAFEKHNQAVELALRKSPAHDSCDNYFRTSTGKLVVLGPGSGSAVFSFPSGNLPQH
ncbi:ABC transporter [Pseudohyphozyma bogoriensis]|nr:ABC transporter [Pseudohyphozyma bogoriensis]